ncbi:hypothetical protein E3N88_20478 [Mikania micrantha]|uniref:Uncharacterized protein n=1 Tax=Mikania micrantha TaxID=192012 RepID=A0A5N6NJQ3_9ASTR|nr:hypothetical protein E3N88_20478 [Mikania micrantha]
MERRLGPLLDFALPHISGALSHAPHALSATEARFFKTSYQIYFHHDKYKRSTSKQNFNICDEPLKNHEKIRELLQREREYLTEKMSDSQPPPAEEAKGSLSTIPLEAGLPWMLPKSVPYLEILNMCLCKSLMMKMKRRKLGLKESDDEDMKIKISKVDELTTKVKSQKQKTGHNMKVSTKILLYPVYQWMNGILNGKKTLQIRAHFVIVIAIATSVYSQELSVCCFIMKAELCMKMLGSYELSGKKKMQVSKAWLRHSFEAVPTEKTLIYHDIVWTPYCDYLSYRAQRIFFSRSVLINFDKIQYHEPEKVPKQLSITDLEEVGEHEALKTLCLGGRHREITTKDMKST